MKDPEHRLITLLDKHQQICVKTVDNQGQTKNRTVVIPKKREGIRHLYFTVDAASGRERYFEYHPKCMVTLRDSRFARGATLHGEVEIVGGGLGSYLCRLTVHSARLYNKFRSEDFILE